MWTGQVNKDRKDCVYRYLSFSASHFLQHGINNNRLLFYLIVKETVTLREHYALTERFVF